MPEHESPGFLFHRTHTPHSPFPVSPSLSLLSPPALAACHLALPPVWVGLPPGTKGCRPREVNRKTTRPEREEWRSSRSAAAGSSPTLLTRLPLLPTGLGLNQTGKTSGTNPRSDRDRLPVEFLPRPASVDRNLHTTAASRSPLPGGTAPTKKSLSGGTLTTTTLSESTRGALRPVRIHLAVRLAHAAAAAAATSGESRSRREANLSERKWLWRCRTLRGNPPLRASSCCTTSRGRSREVGLSTS